MKRTRPIRAIGLTLLALATISACSSFNDPDDDPNLCQNGRRPKPNGQCPDYLAYQLLGDHHKSAAR
ncbi:MAG: hypothetical protein WAU68_02940 [Vitreimonas sp.]